MFYFMLKVLIRSNFLGQNLRYEKDLMCLWVCEQEGRVQTD